MLRHEGFSILEIMVAVAVIAALGLGIYRMQLSALAAAQQGIARQQAMRSADNLLNQLSSITLYQNTTNVARSLPFTETLYIDNNSVNVDCSVQSTTSACNTSQMEQYFLFRWKSQLANTMNLPANNVKAILCADSSLSAPTLTTPNCNGSGNPVIKIVWQSHTQDIESSLLGASSYIMLQVPVR